MPPLSAPRPLSYATQAPKVQSSPIKFSGTVLVPIQKHQSLSLSDTELAVLSGEAYTNLEYGTVQTAFKGLLPEGKPHHDFAVAVYDFSGQRAAQEQTLLAKLTQAGVRFYHDATQRTIQSVNEGLATLVQQGKLEGLINDLDVVLNGLKQGRPVQD